MMFMSFKILEHIAVLWQNICTYEWKSLGAVHLDTVQMPTATHSDRCLEIFHCSSAVIGSCCYISCF